MKFEQILLFLVTSSSIVLKANSATISWINTSEYRVTSNNENQNLFLVTLTSERLKNLTKTDRVAIIKGLQTQAGDGSFPYIEDFKNPATGYPKTTYIRNEMLEERGQFLFRFEFEIEHEYTEARIGIQSSEGYRNMPRISQNQRIVSEELQREPPIQETNRNRVLREIEATRKETKTQKMSHKKNFPDSENHQKEEPEAPESAKPTKNMQQKTKKRVLSTMPSTSKFTSESESKVIKIRARLIPLYDWAETTYDFHRYMKSLMVLVKLFIIFVRPSLHDKHKLPVAWAVSDLLLFEALFQIGYLSGNFGGVLDEVFSGLIKSYNLSFAFDFSGKFLNEKFYKQSRALYMNKYYEFEYIPNPFIKAMFEVCLGVFFIVFPFFAETVGNQRLVKLCKGMKVGWLLTSFFPLVFTSGACLINVIYLNNYYDFGRASAFGSILILVYLGIEVYLMIIPKSRRSVYLNNEEGVLALDFHPNTKAKGVLKVLLKYLEFVVLVALPVALYGSARAGMAGPVIFTVAAILLMTVAACNWSLNGWVAELCWVYALKVLQYFLMAVLGAILVYFWVEERMTLLVTQRLSFAFIGIFGALNLLIAVSLFVRAMIEGLRHVNGRGSLFEEYPALRITRIRKREFRYEMNQTMPLKSRDSKRRSSDIEEELGMKVGSQEAGLID